MKLKLVTGLFLLFLAIPCLAQEKLSFRQVDSLSYDAWYRGDWKQTARIAREGFDHEVDYYYLRMRAGIATLNLNKPEQASIHFRRALNFSQTDSNALVYLYLALVKAGNYQEARLILDSIPTGSREKFEIPAPRIIRNVYLEPGYMLNGEAADLKAYRPEAVLAHHYMVPTYSYVGVGLNLEPQKRLNLTMAANLLSFFAYQQFIIANNEPFEFDVPFDQRALYLAGNYYLGKGFSLTLAGQMLTATYPLMEWQGTNTGGSYVEKGHFYRDLAFNGSLIKRFPFVTFALRADVNRFRDSTCTQAGADLTFYPAGNTDTYIRGEGTWVMKKQDKSGRLVAQGIIGRKIFKSVWMEGYYSYGLIRNYSEKSAYIVYNNFDPIKSRAGINLLVNGITRNLDLAIRYQWSKRTTSWQFYDSSGDFDQDFELKYPMHSIIGGLTWRF